MLLYLLSIADEEVKPNIVALYNEHKDEMLTIILKRLEDAGDTNSIIDAQDVLQNVFVNTVKYINSLPASSEKEQKAYLYAVLRNETTHFIDRYNEIKKESYELNDVPDEEYFLDELEIKERYNDVVKAICSLDEKFSIVLLFKYAKGYKIAKIAKMLGISKPAVSKRLSKGKALLLEALKEKGGITL